MPSLLGGRPKRVWTAIRYRRLQALVIAALAALVTACAVFSPLYDRAVQQATVAIRLDAMPVQLTGLGITSTGASRFPGLDAAALTRLVPPDIGRYLLTGVPSITVPMTRWPDDTASPTGPMFWRAGMCAHVRFPSGRCPTARDEIAVSTADARNYRWGVGSRIPLHEAVFDPLIDNPALHGPHPRMTVVGVFSVRPGRYWYGAAPVGRSGSVSQTAKGVNHPQVDAWLTARSTVDGPAATRWIGAVTEVDFPLDKPSVGVDQMLRLGPAVDRFTLVPDGKASDSSAYSQPDVSVYSGLPGVAREVLHGRDQARVIVPLLMVQLALLAVVVFWLVLGSVTEQRRPEVAVARLRGRGVVGARRMLLGELGAVVLVGVFAGTLAALVLSWVARHAYLPLDPPFELGAGFAVALAVAVVTLLALTAAATQQVAREPISALLRRVPARRSRWRVGALEAMVVAASGTAVVAFATGGLHGPIALAAPALLALLVGIVLGHLLVPVASWAGNRLLARGRLKAGVSALQVARRPSTRRLVAIVTVATALLVFSTDALVVGGRNRAYAAEQQNGAPLVATVDTTDLAGLRAVLRGVDPVGRSVTPVVTITPPDPEGTTTEAVVPQQYARIALFPGQSSSRVPWHRLDPPSVTPLRLVGQSVSMTITSQVTRVGRSRASGPDGASDLRLHLLRADGQTEGVPLETLQPGHRPAHEIRALVPCQQGCQLSGLTIVGPAVGNVQGRLTLSGLTTSTGQRDLQIGARRWRGTSQDSGGSMQPLGGGATDRLALAFRTDGANAVEMPHASIPARLPALSAGALPPDASGDHFQGMGLDGILRDMVRVGTLARVPSGTRHTVVVNLDVLARDGTLTEGTDTGQVWFARDDPALLGRVNRALGAHGLPVPRTSTVAHLRQGLDESAAAWSLQLALLVGLAGLLLAALVLVVVSATTWRVRARDFAALRMTGLSRTAISLVAAGELVPVVALAVVVGAVCGVVGAHLALPTIPLFADAPVVSTLDISIAWIAVSVAAVLALLLLTCIAYAAAWSVARRASLGRVREQL